VTEDFSQYVTRKSRDGCFGNNVEIQCIAEIFNRPVHVYSYSADPINIFHGNYDAKALPPIRLSYHGGNHYNAVIDPYEATVGVGLGLPGMVPGEAEKQQMEKAIAMSEEHMFEKSTVQMGHREDREREAREALSSSDREATEYELEKVVSAFAIRLQHSMTSTDEQYC
jgi:OTU domain-containing protein 5